MSLEYHFHSINILNRLSPSLEQKKQKKSFSSTLISGISSHSSPPPSSQKKKKQSPLTPSLGQAFNPGHPCNLLSTPISAPPSSCPSTSNRPPPPLEYHHHSAIPSRPRPSPLGHPLSASATLTRVPHSGTQLKSIIVSSGSQETSSETRRGSTCSLLWLEHSLSAPPSRALEHQTKFSEHLESTQSRFAHRDRVPLLDRAHPTTEFPQLDRATACTPG